MTQTSLKEQFLQVLEKKAEKVQKAKEEKTNVKVGDLVEVTGTVDEYYIDGYNDKNTTDLPVTQITQFSLQ